MLTSSNHTKILVQGCHGTHTVWRSRNLFLDHVLISAYFNIH